MRSVKAPVLFYLIRTLNAVWGFGCETHRKERQEKEEMSVLNLIGTLFQIVIPVLGWLGKRKEAKAVEALASGIERYSKLHGNEMVGKHLKATVNTFTQQAGIEKHVNKKIKKWQAKLWKKII